MKIDLNEPGPHWLRTVRERRLEDTWRASKLRLLEKARKRKAKRPTGNRRPSGNWAANVFCPTGPGGGVDPSCSPGEASATPLPDPAKVKVIRNLPGSTGPQLVEDEHGKRWVMKRSPRNPGHLRNEAETDAVYRALGVPVNHSGIVETEGGPVKFSEWREGETLNLWSRDKSTAEREVMHREIGKHLAADALLANWDVIGLDQDNILISGGKPFRIDNGGGLRYRARGAEKGYMFADRVIELDVLRDERGRNPEAAEVFKVVTDRELRNQVRDLIGKRETILKAATHPETRKILAKRLDFLRDSLPPAANAKDNCGTGAGGFQQGNTCAKGGNDGSADEKGGGREKVSEGAGIAGGPGGSAGADAAEGGQHPVGPLTDRWLAQRTADGEFTEGFAKGFRLALERSAPAVGAWFEQGRPNGWPVVVERDLDEDGLPPSVKAALQSAQAITVNNFRIEYAKDPSGMGGKINAENLTHELTHTAFRELTKRAPVEVQEAIDEAVKVGDGILKMAFKKGWFTKNPPTNDQDYDTWHHLREVRRMAASVKRYLMSGKDDVTGSLELSLMLPPHRFRELGSWRKNDTTAAGDQWHVVAVYGALARRYRAKVDPVYLGEELVTYKAGKDRDYAQRLFSKLLKGKE